METFKRKRVGQTAVTDNQSSSVTLNELENKARKKYCNFEFQRRSHTMTEINLKNMVCVFIFCLLGAENLRKTFPVEMVFIALVL